MDERLDAIRKFCTFIAPVGSRVTCNPPPLNTDEDWLVLAENWVGLIEHLESAGYERGGSVIPNDANVVPVQDRFVPYRLGELNLICTRSGTFYRRFMAASSIAKRLNLLDKSDRVALFQAVLYGNEDAPKPDAAECRDDGKCVMQGMVP